MTDRSNRILPFVLLSAALVLAGCGVKGPLEPPAGTAATAEPNPLQTRLAPDAPGPSVTSTPTQTSTSQSFTTPLGKEKKKRFRQGGVPITSEPVKPDQPFVLDKLL